MLYNEIILWFGIFTLLVGYFINYKKHYLRIVGFSSLGVFWAGEAPHFILIDDYFNAALCILTLPLFLYFAYNEFLSDRWNEDPEVMRFLSGGISIAMLIYFMVQRIPILAGGLIKAVAVQTNWILRLMGYEFTTSAINYGGNPLLYRANLNDIFVTILGSNINIILACTGLQVIAAAAGLLYSTDSKTNLKLKSLILVIPTVYIANIFRNVLVIYLTVENITSFSIAHNEIAKTGSVIVLVILLIGVFEIMPKFHDNIINVIKLPKRKPIHQKQQR